MKHWMLALAVALGASGLVAQEAPKPETKKAEAGTEGKTAKSDKKEALTLDKLPEAAKAAITKLAGESKLTSLKARGKKDAVIYKAEWTSGGKDHEATVKADGTVLKTEDEVDAKDVPQAVQDAAKKAAPEGATLEWVKVVEGTKTLYEATASKDGKEVKEMAFDAEGKLQADDEDDADDDDGEEADDDHHGEEDDDDGEDDDD